MSDPLRHLVDDLLEHIWMMRERREGSANAFYSLADQLFRKADALAAVLDALPHQHIADVSKLMETKTDEEVATRVDRERLSEGQDPTRSEHELSVSDAERTE